MYTYLYILYIIYIIYNIYIIYILYIYIYIYIHTCHIFILSYIVNLYKSSVESNILLYFTNDKHSFFWYTKSTAPKGNSNFQILLEKIFNLKRKKNSNTSCY